MITKSARGALLLLVLLRFSIPASADRPTNIALSPAAGTFGGTTTLQATLTSTGRPVPNQTISFALNDTPVGSATTNSNGVATLANVSLVGIAANTYSKGVTAIFAGTADLRSSQRNATLTVNPAAALIPLTVKANDATKLQGDPNPAFTVTYTGFVDGDSSSSLGGELTFSTNATTNSPVGAYAVTPGGLTSSKYTITFVSGTLNVVNAALIPLTVKANDATKLQGDPNPAFTVTYTGFVDGDSSSSLGGELTFSTNATTNSPVGAYAVTPGGLTSSKYTITFVSGTLSVINSYVTDNNVYTPPNYLTLQPPAAGGSYTDPVFGIGIKRLTDAMTMPDVSRGGVVTSIAAEYSTMTPFNNNNTRLLLTHFSYFGLYDGDGNFLTSLPFEINTSSEPRWSRTDANVLYYVSGNKLKQYNIGTNSMSVVHTFTEYTRISGRGESDICFDGDHFVLAADNRYVFVYEISSDTKGPVFDTGVVGFDNLYITPNDNVIITWLANGSSRFNGIELFDRNMNFLRQLTHAGAHMDVTRDVNGDEVLVWGDGSDAQLQVPCTNGIMKVRISDGNQTCIWTADWSLATHISAPDGNGWVFVETYAPSDPIPPDGWKVYTNELLQVKLDGTEVRRLAHHRSRPFNTYTWQPKISTSRDGTKVVFGSNFGLQAILGYPTEYSDAYAIDLSIISPR